MPVESIDRPDVNGTPAKMATIGQATQDAIKGVLPHIVVKTDDNIMSNVTIYASKQHKDQWTSGIFHNSPYVIVSITPAKGQRYYDPNTNPQVTVEVTSTGSRNFPKFRKYTGTPEKVIAKFAAYLQAIADQD